VLSAATPDLLPARPHPEAARKGSRDLPHPVPRVLDLLSCLQPLDVCAHRGKLLFETFKPAVKVIDAIDHGLSLRSKTCKNKADAGAKIGCHHRRSSKPFHPMHNRSISLHANIRTHAHQLRNVHEAILEYGLLDMGKAVRGGHQDHELCL